MSTQETALGIPLILEKVFRNLDRENLYRCRQVQRLWNTEACKLLHPDKVSLDSITALRLFNDTFQSSVNGISLTALHFFLNLDNLGGVLNEGNMELTEKEMERFVQIARDNLRTLDIWVSIAESNRDLVLRIQALFYHCFPNLHRATLYFYCVKADDLNSLKATMQFKTRLDTCESNFISGLKELTIYVGSTYNFRTCDLGTLCDECISFTSELSSNAVNMQSVSLHLNDLFQSNSDRKLEESLVKAVLPNLSPNLKQITICPKSMSTEFICALTQRIDLALQDIRLYYIDTSTVTICDLNRLFNRYRNTLQVLELAFLEPFQMSLPPELPLNKLRWLSVENFEGTIEWGKLPAIDDVELVYHSLEDIIPHVLSYPLNLFTQDSLDIQWNSKPQNVFIAKLDENEPYQLPDPSIVTILRGSEKLISFHIIKSRIRHQSNSTNISGKYLRALASHPVYFPIHKFEFIFDADFVSSSMLQQYLNRYHASLQGMQLEFRSPVEFCFPAGNPMNKLADLTLKNFPGSLQWSKLPKLKHVKLDSQSLCAIAPSIVANPDDCKIDSMKCFRGTEQDDDLYITIFAELAPCLLPKLNRLVIGQDCTAPLSAILSSCTHLKRLKLIRCHGVTDELLCGTGTVRPPVIIPEVHDDDNDEICDEDFLLYSQYRTMVKEMRVCSYIGDLKELEHLKIVISDENAFSDISILCGIIDCDKLETLTLQSPNISYETSRRVLQKAKLQHLFHAYVNINDHRIDLEPEELINYD